MPCASCGSRSKSISNVVNGRSAFTLGNTRRIRRVARFNSTRIQYTKQAPPGNQSIINKKNTFVLGTLR